MSAEIEALIALTLELQRKEYAAHGRSEVFAYLVRANQTFVHASGAALGRERR